MITILTNGLEKFCDQSPVIHLKQSSNNKVDIGHLLKSTINRKNHTSKILNILKQNKISNVDLILELSFKEREPWDSSIESSLIESVEYWKKYL